jgi:hypothetical protein
VSGRERRALHVYRVCAWLLLAGLLVTCQEMRRLYAEAEAHAADHATRGFAVQGNEAGGQGNPFDATTRRVGTKPTREAGE